VRFLKKNLFLILIILLAAFLRFFWIGKIPAAIGGDEMVYILTAKTIFLRFTDLSGTWNPLSIFTFHYPAGEGQAELSYFLLAPIVGYAGFSIFAIKAFYAILGIFNVLLIYLITNKLFSKNAALFAGFVAAINPWQIFLARTSYEMGPAVFFFLLSFYLMLVLKNLKILIAVPFLFCAFYSYIATKLAFLPFVICVLIYCYFVNKKYFKQYLTVFLLSFLLVLFFAFTLKTSQVGQRTSEIFFPNNPLISTQVNELKKASIQIPFLNFFDNKLTIYSQVLFTKFINAISFNYLFITADNFYNVGYGFFYLIDLIFVSLGLYFGFSKKRKESILLCAILIFSLAAQLVHVPVEGNVMENFSPHLSLFLAILLIFIGFGLSQLCLIKNKSLKIASILVVVLIYFISLAGFLNVYFFQYSLRDNFGFHVRLMSEYAKLASQNGQEVVIYSPQYQDEFKKYLFYADSLNNNNFSKIKNMLSANEKIVLDNVAFMGCDNSVDPTKTKKVILSNNVCGGLSSKAKRLSIARFSDGGELYGIYNDTMCSRFSLKPYPSNISVNDFDVEQMTAPQFCQTFVISNH